MDNTTATSLFDKFVNETNLRKAWIKARFFAITNMQYFDKVAYDTFEAHLETNLLALRQELMLEHFTFSPLRVFEIPKGDATRKLYFEEPQDAVVTHAIMNVIGERFEAVLPPNIFGHRLNIGSDESKETFKRWSELYNQYTTNARSILQLPNQMWYEISDLTNYYPSINLNNLKGTITTQVTEARLLSLLNQLFSVQALNSQEEYEGIPGLPPGPAYAHFFANIYLIDFDRFMESNTLKYYRYVDDLCFACENQDYLKDLNGKIADFFKNRSDNQLSLSSSKTEQHPVSNGLPLIEHTAKLKYDLRFGVIDTIDQISEIQVDEAKRNAERLFRDIFVSVEREEDLEKIVVKSSGIIAKKLADHVVSRHEARNIAYGLLRLNPPKISAIRALISSLMKLSFDEVEPRQRFIRFLQESSIIIRITFLQLLMGGHSLPDEIYKLLQDNFLVDDNYLVRANAFLALQTHEHSIAIELLRSLQKQETSEYVIKHSIGCFAFLPESQRNTIWIDIASILEKTSTTINTLLIIIFRLIDDNSLPYQILEILFPPIRNHSTHNVYSAISTVFLASNFGNHSMLASSWELLKEKSDAEFSNIIIQVIGFSTFRRLIQKQQTSRLFSFSDSLVELGLPELATFGYQELTVHSDDTEVQRTAREKQGTLDVGSIIPGLPSWYTLQDCDKGLYCGLSDDPEYKCRHFESDTRQINGTLEIISPSRLNSEPDFPSQQDWLNYLQTMHKVKVISLIDCDILPTGQTFALYKIPNGYLTISEWLQREHFSSSEGDVLYLVSIILEKIEKTELATGFIFNNVNPCNVLWNPATQDVLFVNIGSALGIPRYVCINEKKSALHFQKEIGATTSSYFLGLLFLQLLSKTCPVELVQKMSYSFTGQSNSIRTVTAKLDILPHTKSLVFRLLHSKPDYRYSSIVTLTGDIQHILDFKKEISSQTSIDTVSISKLILVDYITFRLKIIQRDPTISYDSTVKRTDDILYRLSHDLELYNNEDLSYWRAKVTWWERGSKLTGIPLWMWLSPESKHLVSLAHTWKELVEQVNQSLSCKYDYVLSYLLLYNLI
jgi:retron-type reverse transcriptase